MALGPVVGIGDYGLETVGKVHDAEFVTFLSTAWQAWSAENGEIDAFPNAWPPPRASRRATKRPGAELGRFCIDMSSPIMAGTWTAAKAAVDAAVTAVDIVAGGDHAAFALCRPPGHHAGRDYFGGYCFLNNAAAAAQAFRDRGYGKVAVLDIDYHHGNGTQDIFYDRADVLTVSIHADPQVEYPYYSGYAEETGEGAGADFNLNLPLPWGWSIPGTGRRWRRGSVVLPLMEQRRWWSRSASIRSAAIRFPTSSWSVTISPVSARRSAGSRCPQFS